MRTSRWRDDEGSLALATLLIVIAIGLSMVLLTSTVRETVNTRTATGRASALLAARTGLASALASLRAARDASGVGKLAQLPCAVSPTAQVVGAVSDTAGTYAATIWYLLADPAEHDEAWLKVNGKTCPTQLGASPQFAYVSVLGVSAGGSQRRTLIGTYQFSLRSKGNMPGGQIRAYQTSSDPASYCLHAETAAPGFPLAMRLCDTVDTTTKDEQTFGYMPNLTIQLMSADPTAYPDGLCAQAGWPQAAGQEVTLQACATGDVRRQQWSFDSSSNFRGTTDGKALNEFCWNIVMPSRATIVLNDSLGSLNNDSSRRCGIVRTDYQSWNVTRDAGSGAAGPESGQLVNFRNFGKCLDYKGNSNNVGDAIWAFPCKQSPSLTDRELSQVWNQVWTLPVGGVGVLYVTDTTGLRHCLRVPGKKASRPDAATAEQCPPANSPAPAEFTWNVRGADAPTYDEKYRIEATGGWAGKCLTPIAVDPRVQGDYVGLVPCSGDYLQKWNAVPPVSTSGLKNVIER